MTASKVYDINIMEEYGQENEKMIYESLQIMVIK